jgi:hypothetical protein
VVPTLWQRGEGGEVCCGQDDWSVPVFVIVNVPEPIVVDGFVPAFAEPHGEIRDEP